MRSGCLQFGSGWSNANYWYAAAAASSHPIATKLLQVAKQAARGHAQLERHVDNYGSSWRPDRFVGLCAEAAASKEPERLSYCARVMQAEFDLLLEHCYSQL